MGLQEERTRVTTLGFRSDQQHKRHYAQIWIRLTSLRFAGRPSGLVLLSGLGATISGEDKTRWMHTAGRAHNFTLPLQTLDPRLTAVHNSHRLHLHHSCLHLQEFRGQSRASTVTSVAVTRLALWHSECPAYCCALPTLFFGVIQAGLTIISPRHLIFLLGGRGNLEESLRVRPRADSDISNPFPSDSYPGF